MILWKPFQKENFENKCQLFADAIDANFKMQLAKKQKMNDVNDLEIFSRNLSSKVTGVFSCYSFLESTENRTQRSSRKCFMKRSTLPRSLELRAPLFNDRYNSILELHRSILRNVRKLNLNEKNKGRNVPFFRLNSANEGHRRRAIGQIQTIDIDRWYSTEKKKAGKSIH